MHVMLLTLSSRELVAGLKAHTLNPIEITQTNTMVLETANVAIQAHPCINTFTIHGKYIHEYNQACLIPQMFQ
jgi:hypothetical protein